VQITPGAKQGYGLDCIALLNEPLRITQQTGRCPEHSVETTSPTCYSTGMSMNDNQVAGYAFC